MAGVGGFLCELKETKAWLRDFSQTMFNYFSWYRYQIVNNLIRNRLLKLLLELQKRGKGQGFKRAHNKLIVLIVQSQ